MFRKNLRESSLHSSSSSFVKIMYLVTADIITVYMVYYVKKFYSKYYSA